VPIPDVVERLPPRKLLIAGSEVDLRVPERPATVVEVTTVDVDPCPVEPVDDLAEAAEVDRDRY
jgi:hypothetical protein